jgi:hypothetical protein
MTMPAGRYYIGDLCYVMHDAWDECVDLFFPPDVRGFPSGAEGEFTLKDGRRFASFGTAYGDGVYRSNLNTFHSVDSGSIGCIRVEDIRDNTYDPARIEELGAIVEFDQPFEVSSDQGLLVFGHVEIETADDGDDEYDDEESDYVDEE